MSEQIDWSKAPEGATVLLKNVRDGAYAVSESYDDGAKTWHWPDQRYSFNLMPSMWRIVAERPTTTSWSGEGLPPVGADIEFKSVGGEWVAGQYIGQFNGLIVAGCHQTRSVGYLESGEFRPIRTPEQIAEDEREAAVNDMHAIYMKGSVHGGGLYAIYDAGYRKP